MSDLRVVSRRQQSTATPSLVAWRCPACNGMLARVFLAPGSMIQIKCSRCNAMVTKEAA